MALVGIPAVVTLVCAPVALVAQNKAATYIDVLKLIHLWAQVIKQ